MVVLPFSNVEIRIALGKENLVNVIYLITYVTDYICKYEIHEKVIRDSRENSVKLQTKLIQLEHEVTRLERIVLSTEHDSFDYTFSPVRLHRTKFQVH